jgi:hypothetical protein
MALSAEAAYAQIKTLENTGQLTLPEPRDTVEVGTVDPATGTFTWSVPTLVQTISEPPGPGGRTNTIIELTVGVVSTKAVDLLLKFAIVPQRLENAPLLAERTAARIAVDRPAQISGEPAGEAKSVDHPAQISGEPAGEARRVVDPVQISEFAGETNGGVTIAGFPTVSSTATEITLDAGLICSVVDQASTTSPPISRIPVQIEIPGHPSISIWLFVLRPPVVGMGAFTVPALPMAIVYAPPQGKLMKNTATYSDAETSTRTVSSSLTTTTVTKTVQAYSAAELIAKVAGAIAAVVAVVGTGGAGAAGAASVAGALGELGSALSGPAKEKGESAAEAAKQVGAELSLVASIVSGLEASAPPSASTSATAEADHSLTLTLTNTDQFPSEAGLGPGDGDRIVYLKDVKVIWMAVNGEVGINVLGFAGVGGNSAHDLLAEQQSLASGAAPRLGLDAQTIESLLGQDPLIPSHRPVVSQRFGPAVVGPPRFVPAHPPGHSGSGTGNTGTGDQVIATYEATTDDKQTTTSTQTTVTDMKPGFLSVLFGSDDTETTTTGTLTSTQSIDTKMGEKLTSTITFFSEGANDPYDVKILYDNTFGTYAILDADSPLLVGSPAINAMATEVSGGAG